MACRISKKVFDRMAGEEAKAHGLKAVGAHEEVYSADDFYADFSLAGIALQTALLNRKAIQSLVDEPEQARPIIRNLLRWAKEHGAR